MQVKYRYDNYRGGNKVPQKKVLVINNIRRANFETENYASAPSSGVSFSIELVLQEENKTSLKTSFTSVVAVPTCATWGQNAALG